MPPGWGSALRGAFRGSPNPPDAPKHLATRPSVTPPLRPVGLRAGGCSPWFSFWCLSAPFSLQNWTLDVECWIFISLRQPFQFHWLILFLLRQGLSGYTSLFCPTLFCLPLHHSDDHHSDFPFIPHSPTGTVGLRLIILPILFKTMRHRSSRRRCS